MFEARYFVLIQEEQEVAVSAEQVTHEESQALQILFFESQKLAFGHT